MLNSFNNLNLQIVVKTIAKYLLQEPLKEETLHQYVINIITLIDYGIFCSKDRSNIIDLKNIHRT